MVKTVFILCLFSFLLVFMFDLKAIFWAISLNVQCSTVPVEIANYNLILSVNCCCISGVYLWSIEVYLLWVGWKKQMGVNILCFFFFPPLQCVMIVETPNLEVLEKEESFLFFLLNLQIQRLSHGDDATKYIYWIFVWPFKYRNDTEYTPVCWRLFMFAFAGFYVEQFLIIKKKSQVDTVRE